MAAGLDGAVWFVNYGNNSILRATSPSYSEFVGVSPKTGPPNTSVVIAGSGYQAGETVVVTYTTRLLAPNPTAVTLCSTTAATNHTFTCDASIPTGTPAGAAGTHKIVAKSTTSLRKAKTSFTLT